MIRPPPTPTLFPYTTLFRSAAGIVDFARARLQEELPEHVREISGVKIVADLFAPIAEHRVRGPDRKSTRLNSSHVAISYAVFCLKKKKKKIRQNKTTKKKTQ